MQYGDVMISASEIGNVLGCFGPWKQYGTLCRLWRSSTFKTSFEADSDLNTRNEEETKHLEQLGIVERWAAIQDTCDTQEQLASLELTAFALLFNHAVVLENLSSEITERFLKVFDQHEPSDSIDSLLQAALAEKMCASQVKRRRRAEENCSQNSCPMELSYRLFMRRRHGTRCEYGKRGEKKFIQLYNAVHASPIDAHSRHYSRAMPTHALLPHLSLILQGQIDGMRGGRIVEIKHRSGLVKDELPLHEKMQLHAYMFLLDHTDATLIQCAQTREGVFAKEMQVPFEAEFWASVMHRLVRCVYFLQTLHAQPLARKCFLLLDTATRAAVLQDHLQQEDEEKAAL